MQYDRRSGILFDSFAMDLPRRARPRERGTCGRAEIRKSAGCVPGEIRCREAAGTGMAIAEAWMRGNGVLRGPSAFMGRVQLVRASEDARTLRASSDGCAVWEGRQGLCPRTPSREPSSVLNRRTLPPVDCSFRTAPSARCFGHRPRSPSASCTFLFRSSAPFRGGGDAISSFPAARYSSAKFPARRRPPSACGIRRPKARTAGT